MNFRHLYSSILAVTFMLTAAYAAETGDKPAVDPALEAIQALGEQAPPTPELPAQTLPDAPVTAGPAADVPVTETGATTAAPVLDEPASTGTEPAAAVTEPVAAPAGPRAKDVVLVLDNSGSMKKNDPQFIAKQAVIEFTGVLDEATRVAVVIFDQDVRIALPLTDMNDATRDSILKSLDQVNYKGQFTNSPDAIERAMYELKTNGRADAEKLIVFMTDGIVDTGNKENDLQKGEWLKEELAADAAESGIRIFGIAYTENADFHLIQSIAQTTGGEYYRAMQADELKNIFEQVRELINKVPEPEPVAQPVVEPPPVQAAPPPPPVIIEVPVQTKSMDKEEKLRSRMILVALSVLIIAVIIMVLMLLRGGRRRVTDEQYAQEAYLNDINNYSGQPSYKLGSMPTMLGRVAGTDKDHLNYIVIPQTTIGRRHALIEYKDFAYWIIDQGSINGTFVNDHMINSETRLKHGDRVRLHKYEFEFVMPEMVDAGMTVISKTTLAANPAADGSDVTAARGTGGDEPHGAIPEPDFDITGSSGAREGNPDEEDTVIRGGSGKAGKDENVPDETIMMDDEDVTSMNADDDATIRPDADEK